MIVNSESTVDSGTPLLRNTLLGEVSAHFVPASIVSISTLLEPVWGE